MPKCLAEDSLSLQQRQCLLMDLPLFSILSQDESAELAALLYEERYAADEVIVKEEELIDKVFIIIQGQAEVSHTEASSYKITKQTKAPLAILGIGDAIGLNDTGFFSDTGRRKATVTAATQVDLAVLDLKSLHTFLQKHPHLQSAMYLATEKLLKIKLIKQSLPFNRLAHERLEWLAAQVETIQFSAGEIIFNEGEVGDRCYLIQSGCVEIITHDTEYVEQHIALLKTPTLFGEATLMTHSPRNATARAVENTTLLMIKHDFLSELIESEDNVAHMFMNLMVDRSKPLINPAVIAHHRITADKQAIVILKNPQNGSYFKLSAEGWFIWKQMNGQHTMQAITLSLAENFGIFAPDVVAGLISKLAKAGFISNLQIDKEVHLKNQPYWARALLRIQKILDTRAALGDADKWLTEAYNKVIYLLFTPLGKILLSLLAITGMCAFGLATQNIVQIFSTLADSWILFIFLVPFTVLSVALHELGHAFVTKSFGYEVHYMGVGWYWFGPVAFTDTSDMWLSSRRWPRIMVNLAGICADLLVAGISSLLIFVFSNPYIQGFLWIYAIFTYINAFRMLSPMQELDGYYVLMDLLEKPNLRKSAVNWLVKGLPKAVRRPKLFRRNKAEAFYWVTCIIFLGLLTVLALSVQTFIFDMFGFHTSNIFVNLATPLLVVFITSLGIITDVRTRSEE